MTFASYNLENYTLSHSDRARAKPADSRDAAASIAAEVRPDILGLCEVGSPEALADLRERLRQRGSDFAYAEYVAGPDPDRHLALLSRYPMAERHSQTYIPFELNGVPELVRRGFLDVTVQITPTYTLRLIGVHLKSKVQSPEGQDQVRRREAALLRRYVDRVLAQNPSVNLLVYGDFNDTRDADCFKEILGGRGCIEPLKDLPAQDAGGQRWTHYWQHADVYSRIDYLLANRGLKPELVSGTAKISDSLQWRKASDHRLLYTAIIPCER